MWIEWSVPVKAAQVEQATREAKGKSALLGEVEEDLKGIWESWGRRGNRGASIF